MQKLTPRGVLVYSHVGAFHRADDMAQQLGESLAAKHRRTTVISTMQQAVEWVNHASSDDVGLILDLESILTRNEEEGELSRLRPALQRANESGASVLVTSGRPPLSFPSLVGSSLFADATHVRLPPLTDPRAGEWILRRSPVSDSSLANLIRHANGSRRLLDDFLQIELAGALSGNEKVKAARKAEYSLACDVFAELGQELASELSFWVHDCEIFDPNESDLSRFTDTRALKGAGVLRVSADGKVDLLPFHNKVIWSDALALTLDSQFDPSEDWVALIQEFYSFERRLRYDLRVHFEENVGSDWATKVLASRASSILELARFDGHPRATSIEHLRSPLDWLTLGVLLELAESVAGPKPGLFLGCGGEEWHRIGSELTSVRNRLAHMRQLRMGDAGVMKRKLHILDMRRKNNSGGPP
ncbi:hypothetical protein [Rhodococcus sp. X156]|uniref:hypothetical protein n=1 Tax=Rhodococcus sp. X156 TaxID=2499145 RepID=UPI000FD91E90|nr:hypothetical protein [Rhodococcus sp. X156]